MAGISVYMAGRCGVTCTYAPSAAAACTGENITITFQGGGRYPSTVTSVTAYDTDFTRNRTVGGTDGVLPVGSVLVLDGPFFSPGTRHCHRRVPGRVTDGRRRYLHEMRYRPGQDHRTGTAPRVTKNTVSHNLLSGTGPGSSPLFYGSPGLDAVFATTGQKDILPRSMVAVNEEQQERAGARHPHDRKYQSHQRPGSP